MQTLSWGLNVANTKLKAAIYAESLNQKLLAEMAGISELDLSRIVTGRRQPTLDEQKLICRLLGSSTENLFGSTVEGGNE